MSWYLCVCLCERKLGLQWHVSRISRHVQGQHGSCIMQLAMAF